MAYANADRDTLEAALIGHEAQLGTIEAKIEEIRRQLRGRAPTEAAGIKPKIPREKRNMSAAARKRIAADRKQLVGSLHESKGK